MSAALDKTDFVSKAQVDIIHKTLYKFSNTSMHNLLKISEPFRLILRESLRKKDEIFNCEENK